MIGIHITCAGNELALQFPYDQILIEKAKSLPQRRWDKENKRWLFKPTLANIEFIKKWFPEAEWHEDTDQFVEDAEGRKVFRQKTAELKATMAFDFDVLRGVPFKLPPMEHQKKALLLGRNAPAFAYIMDQGTGKTKVVIDDAAHNWREGRIDGLIVFAPNSVKTNWVDPADTYSETELESDMDEIAKHMAPDVPVNKGCWVSSPNKREKEVYKAFRKRWGEENVLHILIVNVEALHVDRVKNECLQFVISHKSMAVCDESTRIKNRAAKRTKNAIQIRHTCPLARIMSGTPLIKSPLDAFAQFNFLDPDIIGYSNFYSFRNHFATMGGFNNYQVLYYQNLDELASKIDTVSYRVLKKDCLDLPPQVYIRRDIEMTSEQKKAYKQMRTQCLVELEKYEKDGGRVTAAITLTKMLRLQQIVGGYLPKIDPDTMETIGQVEIVKPDRNPKFQEVMNVIDESGDQKIVVWCRFRAEIAGLAKLLKKNKIEHLEFHGGIKSSDRRDIRKAFFTDPRYKVLIGNQDAGGIGIDEFKIASLVIYLSNSFSTENRVQSEDRTHRIGSEVHSMITYYDLVAKGTVDTEVMQCLRSNVAISKKIMKDGYKEWI